MPFTDLDDSIPAHLRLEPVGSHRFRIVRGFKYRVPESGALILVGKEETDLASVPFFLQWFIRSYGRHTLAAVLHDHLWRLQRGVVPLDNTAFKDSNRLFRVAMDELDVPLVRRWLMWSAVSLAWLSKRESPWKVRVISWVAAIVGLDALTAWVLVEDVGAPAVILAAILLVASLVLLWPHVVVTLIGGPALYLLAPSILVVLATLLAFLVVEGAVYVVAWMLARVFKRRIPPPNSPLLKRERPPEASTAVVTVVDAEEHRSSV